jgi:hypothetical protein
MGVAVAKFMVAAMGGKLAIATRATADALYAFTIEFPVLPTPDPPARASYASLVTLPVLVVSGDPAQRLTLTNLLRGWRMVPLEADNASMAMALLERLEEENNPIPSSSCRIASRCRTDSCSPSASRTIPSSTRRW